MKRLFTIAAVIFGLLPGLKGEAQTFTVAHDTVYFTYTPGTGGSGTMVVPDDVTTSTNMAIKWNATATNFPSDWQAGTGICDNSSCYSSALLYPSLTVKTSNTYDSGVAGDFHMQFSLGSSTPTTGCYYYTVKLESAIALYTQYVTFIGCIYPASVPTVKSPDEVIIYPNPAANEVNVVFDGNQDIKTVSIYNLIGKPVSVFKVAGDSANLNIENIPTGIYFIRLINSHGDVVQTRKFTKQ